MKTIQPASFAGLLKKHRPDGRAYFPFFLGWELILEINLPRIHADWIYAGLQRVTYFTTMVRLRVQKVTALARKVQLVVYVPGFLGDNISTMRLVVSPILTAVPRSYPATLWNLSPLK